MAVEGLAGETVVLLGAVNLPNDDGLVAGRRDDHGVVLGRGRDGGDPVGVPLEGAAKSELVGHFDCRINGLRMTKKDREAVYRTLFWFGDDDFENRNGKNPRPIFFHVTCHYADVGECSRWPQRRGSTKAGLERCSNQSDSLDHNEGEARETLEWVDLHDPN